MIEVLTHNPDSRVDSGVDAANELRLHQVLDHGLQAHVIRGERLAGRDPSNGLVLPEIMASRFHFRIFPRDGDWWIEDLGSANGTIRNGHRVQMPERLAVEDELLAGGTLFEVAKVSGRSENPRELLAKVHHSVGQLMAHAPEADPETLIRREASRLTSQPEIVDQVVRQALGLGCLDPLLEDARINEILVNGTNTMYVERDGRLQSVDNPFGNNEELETICSRIAHGCGRKVDSRNPLMDGRLPGGERVHIALPPVAIDGPYISIRKFAASPFTGMDLIEKGSLTEAALAHMKSLVQNRKNCLVTGGTGTGKTTILNLLSGYVSPDERIVTIEDAAELRLEQPHVVRLETRPPRPEGAPAVPIRELVRAALRMRPDRIVVGECRGGEALDMLQAMNTGHDGSMTTLHANDPRDALRRLEVLVLYAGVELPLLAVRQQIVSALDGIVHLRRLGSGQRIVADISMVERLEGDVPVLNRVYQWSGHD